MGLAARGAAGSVEAAAAEGWGSAAAVSAATDWEAEAAAGWEAAGSG